MPDAIRLLVPRRLLIYGLVLTALALAGTPSPLHAESDAEFFESKIRPLLAQRCLTCHSAERGKTHGGLALDTRDGWRTGGDSGPAIIPGKPAESLVLRAIGYADENLQMPPEDAGGKLTDEQIALLTEWIRRGAYDPRIAAARLGGMTEQEVRDWWSFQPLRSATPPEVDDPDRVRNGVDNFLQSRLEAAGLSPAAEADRRTLIRRATYDLTGLPPSPEEVAAFLADDAPHAFERLIERLLDSPHYGERWGRHWLDLVRYADTAGENTDHPIPDAWRYRNWVIDAINRDLPYDEFVREQLAGDLLHPDDPEAYASGTIATGFLAIARRFDHDSDQHMHLTYEDTIDTLGKTFLGLSIACARCHDHKYDPITARDYYALYGILASTRYAFPGCEAKQQPRDLAPLLTPAEWTRLIEPHDREVAALEAELKGLADKQAEHVRSLHAAVEKQTRSLARGTIDDAGAQSFADLPGDALDAIEIRVGEMLQLTVDPQDNYGADSTLVEWEITELDGELRRWNLTEDVIDDFLAGNPHADRLGHASVWMFLDPRGGPTPLPETVRDLSGRAGLHVWRNGDNPAVFVNATEQPIPVWTSLPPRTLFVHPAPDGPVAIAWVSPIAGRIRVTGRIADAHPGGPNGIGWRLEHIAGDHSAAVRSLSENGARRSEFLAARTELEARAPAREVAYAVTEGTPANARVHLRGDPEKLGDEVPRRWLEVFGGEPLPPESGSGRRQLAQWLSIRGNPLAARVMVNRIWLHHFGQGLVRTPNDFGSRGIPPAHPELLDWLAQQFVDSGGSLKAMHRLIMNSAAYRRSNGDSSLASHAHALEADPTNELCWRFDRRRLSAEELRDSLLVASREIDLTPGGPHPIPPTTSWSYTQHVPFAGVPETNQRSVYLLTLRNRRHPFLGLFDGADPNATTPQRQVTTVPTQSLYFLNDPFFHRQAEIVAARLLEESDDEQRLRSLYRTVLQREPTSSERDRARDFLLRYLEVLGDVAEHNRPALAWGAFTRVLLSSNEFLYLD